MNIRELFERAYSDAYEKYPFSDTNTAMSGIMGKAEKMKKENITRINAKDLPAPESSGKHSRAPMIGGIAAGVAAALSVGFFAGSLNSGGIQFTPLKEGGAGYSANEELPETEPVTEEITEAAETDIIQQEQPEEEITEKLDAFLAEEEENDLETKSFRFTDDNMLITFEAESYGSESSKTIVCADAHLLEMTVAPTEVMLRYRDDRLKPDNTELVDIVGNAPIEFKMADGHSIFAEVTLTEFDGINHDHDFIVLAEMSEPVSLAKVNDITIGMTAVWGETIDAYKMYMEEYDKHLNYLYAPLYKEADEWYDLDEYRVHVTGYTFDGISLRLGYDIELNEDCGYISKDFVGGMNDSRSAILPVSESIDKESVGILSGGTVYQSDEKYKLSTEWDFYLYEPADEITVTLTAFPLTRGANHPQVPGEEFTFTAKLRDDTPIKIMQPDASAVVKDSLGNDYPVEWISLSEKEISAIIGNIPYTSFNTEPAKTIGKDLAEIRIRFVLADGSETTSKYSLGQPFAEGKTYLHYSIPEIIDPENVAEIWFNDNRIV